MKDRSYQIPGYHERGHVRRCNHDSRDQDRSNRSHRVQHPGDRGGGDQGRDNRECSDQDRGQRNPGDLESR